MGYRDEASYGLWQGEWTFWLVFWRVVIPLVILTSILGVIGWVVSVPTGIAQRVINPDAIVQNYEWFESQHEDIKAADVQIEGAERAITRFKADAGPRESWRFDERQEYGQLTSNLDGLQQYRARLVADYNAKSRMITRSAWKRSDLPHHID